MEVNINGQNNQIIYPQNLKKYSGYVKTMRSQSKFGHNRIVSFKVRIRVANFKYHRNFKSKNEAEAELIRQNIENNLEIKNVMRDCGDHYKVKLPDGKEFLTDKIDLHFIEGYTWSSANNYVVTHQNRTSIRFHNLILNHKPTINSSVDHINRNPLDNRRINLRIATRQTQLINRAPLNGTIQSGVNFNGRHWITTWIDTYGVQKNRKFNINKLGYEAAKQLAIAKRLEMELTLNHYRLALHNLPPLEPDNEPDELEPEVPDEEPGEI